MKMIRPPTVIDQPKLEDRWVPGIWYGKTMIGDIHMVGTPNGVICSRDVRLVPEQDEDHMLLEGMRWTSWNPRKDVEILDPRAKLPSKDQRIVDRSLEAPYRASFDEFVKDMGDHIFVVIII